MSHPNMAQLLYIACVLTLYFEASFCLHPCGRNLPVLRSSFPRTTSPGSSSPWTISNNVPDNLTSPHTSSAVTIPPREVCRLKRKWERSIAQLEKTLEKYHSLNRLPAEDEAALQYSWYPTMFNYYKSSNDVEPLGQLYLASTIVEQYLDLVLSSEVKEFREHFNPQQTVIRELSVSQQYLAQLRCSIYLQLNKTLSGKEVITSSLQFNVTSEDVMFEELNLSRVQQFKRDFHVVYSAKRLLELSGSNVTFLNKTECF